MSFLDALGSIGGGFSKTVDPAIMQQLQSNQQNQGSAAAGQVLQQLYGGGAQPQQSPLAGLLSKLGINLGGQPPQQAAFQPQPQSQPQQPQGQQQSGFPQALQFTLGQEGGFNPSDSNGSPSNFGVNQAANPDVNVAQLTPQTAAPIYKQRYWDAIDGDKLPPQLQKMAFDTSVMSGPQAAKEMLRQSGGDPQKFMQIRQAFQSKLFSSDPQKYGKYADAWAKRNQALMPQQAQGQPQGGPTPPVGQMTLQQIVMAAKQANPHMPPQQLMSVVDRLTPVMNAQAMQQYRQVQQQLAGRREDETERYHGEETQGKEQALDEKKAEFSQRQDRLRTDADARLKEKYDALSQAKNLKEAADKKKEAEDAIKDQLTAERAEISAAGQNVDPKEADRLKKEAAQRADEAQKRVDEIYKSMKTGQNKPADKPAAAKDSSEKTQEINVGGKKYRYKGSGDWNDRANWDEVPES